MSYLRQTPASGKPVFPDADANMRVGQDAALIFGNEDEIRLYDVDVGEHAVKGAQRTSPPG